MTTSAPTGVLIPLYTYPTDGTWVTVEQTKRAHPSVPFLAVVNPHNGVGASPNDGYVRGIPALQNAGVAVLGYVYTQYAKRDISEVQKEIDLFESWYHVDGIFFDEAASQPGQEGYYSSLTQRAKALGMKVTVCNPGARAPSYVGAADLLVTYEHGGLPPLAGLSGSSPARESFAAIAYAVPDLDAAWLADATQYFSYVYTTDKGMPNPYDALPSYFGSLVAKLLEG